MLDFGKRFHYDHSFLLESIKLGYWELFQIGELCLEPENTVEAHDQKCYELSYIISGSGSFVHNGKSKGVMPGDLIFSPCIGTHEIVADEYNQLHYAYVGFKPIANNDVFLEYNNFFSENIARFCSKDSNVYKIFRNCIDEFHREQPTDFLMVEACLTRLIITCYRIFTQNTDVANYTAGIKNSGQLLYRVIKYIEQNSHTNLTVKSVANGVGYSSFYLSHIFKEKMGVTIQEFIKTRRIERAKELMLLNRFTLTQIAEQLGYINVQTFSRTFKNIIGIPPAQFLKESTKNKNSTTN